MGCAQARFADMGSAVQTANVLKFRDGSRKQRGLKGSDLSWFGTVGVRHRHGRFRCASYQRTDSPRKSGQPGFGFAPAPKSAPWAPPGTRTRPVGTPAAFNAASIATDSSNGTDSSVSPWIRRVGGALGET